MNGNSKTSLDLSVASALSAAGGRLQPSGAGRWFCAGPEGLDLAPLLAWRCGSWLVIEPRLARSPALARVEGWDALIRADSMPGMLKTVLHPERGLSWRAEICLGGETNLARRVSEVFLAFERWERGEAWASRGDARETSIEELDLKGLCAEAGWLFVVRSSRELRVDLEVEGDAYAQAVVEGEGQGIRLRCDLGCFDSELPECREAVAGLLLSLADKVRLLRACAGPGVDGAAALRLEVHFESVPAASEISSALESLSVGCSLCGEEIKTLQNPAVAQRYLDFPGWGQRSTAIEQRILR